jgi:spermidine synthase
MNALGRHILVEFNGCSPEILNDVSVIESAMVDAAQKAGATVIQSSFHHFSPFGVSGVVVIQESHLAIHTWPEYGVAAIDLFTCDPNLKAEAAIAYIAESLEARAIDTKKIPRGAISQSRYVEGSSPADKTL